MPEPNPPAGCNAQGHQLSQFTVVICGHAAHDSCDEPQRSQQPVAVFSDPCIGRLTSDLLFERIKASRGSRAYWSSLPRICAPLASLRLAWLLCLASFAGCKNRHKGPAEISCGIARCAAAMGATRLQLAQQPAMALLSSKKRRIARFRCLSGCKDESNSRG